MPNRIVVNRAGFNAQRQEVRSRRSRRLSNPPPKNSGQELRYRRCYRASPAFHRAAVRPERRSRRSAHEWRLGWSHSTAIRATAGMALWRLPSSWPMTPVRPRLATLESRAKARRKRTRRRTAIATTMSGPSPLYTTESAELRCSVRRPEKIDNLAASLLVLTALSWCSRARSYRRRLLAIRRWRSIRERPRNRLRECESAERVGELVCRLDDHRDRSDGV